MAPPSATPPDPPSAASGSWSELASAALVGTARRSVPRPAGVPQTDRGDPALDLLDRAALAAVRRRAGRPLLNAAPDALGTFGPAPAETAPPAPERAARRLGDLVSGGSAPLLEWLGLAARHGVRVPPAYLPELLERCSRDHRGLGRALLPVAGERGLWLAGHTSRWAYLRRLDRAAAFTAEEWRARPAEERRTMLEDREPHLGPADEELLEEALADRSARVRGLAMALIAQLPGTERGRRLGDRARRHVRRGAEGRIEVRLPDLADPDLAGELGVAPRGGADADASTADAPRRETRRQRLWTLIAHAPLRTWLGHLGDTPAEIAGLAAAEDTDLLEALANAAVMQRDLEWARALLPIVLERLTGAHDVSASRGPALLALLPPQEHCALPLERAAALRAEGRGDTVGALLPVVEHVECAWHDELGAVVVDALCAARHGDATASMRRLCEVAATRLPPRLRGQVVDAAHDPEASERGRTALGELAETLRFRSEMHEEFR